MTKLLRIVFIALAVVLLTSCLAGAVKTFGMVFGQRLVSIAAHNYSPEYGSDVEELIYAIAADVKAAREDKDKPEATAYAPADDGYGTQDGYYDQAMPVDGDMVEQGEVYEQATGYAYYPDAIVEEDMTLQPVVLDVDVLAQRMSDGAESPPLPIEDGATLYSSPGNPLAGDKIKLSFRSSCDCYVYIVGIDATGYVTSVFPDPDSQLQNPVTADRQYLIPTGTEWYGLDDYKGVEEIYFIASYNRRLDLERIIQRLSKQERAPAADYMPVRSATMAPRTRGIVKIDMGTTAQVAASNGDIHRFSPSTFKAQSADSDLVVTRWFNHQ